MAGLVDAAATARVALLVGVDACSHGGAKRDHDRLIEKGSLPYFAVVWSPGLKAPLVWRQRSTTSKNWSLARQDANGQARVFDAGGLAVGVVLCGEGFSTPIRESLVAVRPGLVVLPAHAAGGGLRHWRALGYFRDHGLPAVRAVHASGGAENALWLPRKKERAIVSEVFSSGEMCVRASVFELA